MTATKERTINETTPPATTFHPFFTLSPNAGFLFEVRAGVPLTEALQTASNFLAAASAAANELAEDRDDPKAFGVAYLIAMARAAVDASTEGAASRSTQPAKATP